MPDPPWPLPAQSSAITAVEDVKDESSKELEAIKADLDEYRRDSRTEGEVAARSTAGAVNSRQPLLCQHTPELLSLRDSASVVWLMMSTMAPCRVPRGAVERAFLQLQTLLEEKDKRSPPDIGPALAEAVSRGGALLFKVGEELELSGSN